MKDTLPDAESGTRSLRNTAGMPSTGNKSIKLQIKTRQDMTQTSQRRVKVMKKLDQTKVGWIIREKCNGVHNIETVKTQKIFVRWAQKLWKKYKDMIVLPAPRGRPKGCTSGRLEHSTVLCCFTKAQVAVSLKHQ